MENPETNKRLDRIAFLLVANLIVMAVGAGALVFGLLPKLNRVEQRFQSFADEVQPVVSAGAGKAIESIKKIDADQISKAATKRSSELIDAASERAKRFISGEKKQGSE
ncbi:MAG: hypothetical protein RL088_3597 [Verrucomicrobiota bacterium]|jgi:hypothetical protein